ncbi:hypothetical protein NC653_027021 [Populus alba x Populus x berolinensis]|uniref:Uncharacterized protein n=1 Tax=Populus alba x Populus x berolinensis TaxID=444605 RepID=A0AAD6M4I7_9ROSI|nr:hypothetical protein NC653_027021 [Populus alba x Populus x berolinensis]
MVFFGYGAKGMEAVLALYMRILLFILLQTLFWIPFTLLLWVAFVLLPSLPLARFLHVCRGYGGFGALGHVS